MDINFFNHCRWFHEILHIKTTENFKCSGIPILRETITMFGTPSIVISDRGTNFDSRSIRNLFNELNIQHHLVATGTPRGNGQAERYISTVID